MAKYDSFYDTQCVRVSHASRQVSYLWLELKRVHWKSTRNGKKGPMWTVQTLMANDTVPIARTMQGTTVQDTVNSALKKLTLQRLASH